MAYIPPHKRHSKETGSPPPVPALLEPQFKNLNFRPAKFDANQSGKIVHGNMALHTWFSVGLDDDQNFPSTILLQPTSIESVERRVGQKPLVLVNSGLINEDHEVGQGNIKKPWAYIAKRVVQDLISSFEIVRSEMEGQSMEETIPVLVARFGRILFNGSSTPINTCLTEASLKQLTRSFYRNLPAFYIENVIPGLIPEVGLTFEEEKDIYHIQLSDKTRPGSEICCQCTVVNGEQGLELYRVVDQFRHMVVDMSCLDKDLDLRLILLRKRILTAMDEDEMNSIRDLINAAVLDSSVKGGLRWPLGKVSCGRRYSVVRVWHTISKTYTNSSVRLKVSHVDSFDFRASLGEVTQQANLELKMIASDILERHLGIDSVTVMLEDVLKIIWKHFLRGGHVERERERLCSVYMKE